MDKKIRQFWKKNYSHKVNHRPYIVFFIFNVSQIGQAEFTSNAIYGLCRQYVCTDSMLLITEVKLDEDKLLEQTDAR